MTDPLLRLTSFAGLFVLVALAWALSENRRAVPWRLVAWGMALQFALGLLVMHTRAGVWFFDGVRKGFDVITDASAAGGSFVFGNLNQVFFVEKVGIAADGSTAPEGPFIIAAVIAFRVLPVIIFVSALSAILLHLGVVQWVIRGIAWIMRRTLKTSGAETFATALLVFLGIESVSALGSHLKGMTRSEIFTIMTAFLATIAASVMVAYAGFGAEPGHLLAASLMSAPAALVMAKIMIPEMGTPTTSGNERIMLPVESQNIFDAAARGAQTGVAMALNVAAMLIVFVGLIYLIDLAVVKVTGQTTTALIGWVFMPFAAIMGVPWSDIGAVSELLATKSVFNEFLAYQNMQPMIESGVLSERSRMIATYALCGFANPGSLGILIGGLDGLMPERRAEVAAMSVKAFVAGTLACFCTACVAGVLGCHPARILTIAGSDSSGGAGIQADLKTILALGGYGMSAITAITAQNTLGVTGVQGISAEMVAAQILAVLEDPGVDAIKTGMLLNREIIEAIADVLDQHPGLSLVLDPVMVATSGARLIDEDAQELVITRLFRHATVITPNLPEADALTGLRITDQQSLQAAGAILHDLGARAVLIKGGHGRGDEVVDWLFDGSEWHAFAGPRIRTTGGHGTGCTLASAIATRLGQGLNLHAAVESARAYVNGALEHAWPDFGKGTGPLNHGWGMGSKPGGEWFH